MPNSKGCEAGVGALADHANACNTSATAVRVHRNVADKAGSQLATTYALWTL